VGKVTSKLRVTVPKAIADRYDIRPGDELEWVPAGDGTGLCPPDASLPPATVGTA
jgi:AbrB family looped-hinge helix DNA binding protein